MTPEQAKQYADVSAYRNTLMILTNLQGSTDEAWKNLREYLKVHTCSGQVTSGWAMKRFGGKSESRWSEVVNQKIGVFPGRCVHSIAVKGVRNRFMPPIPNTYLADGLRYIDRYREQGKAMERRIQNIVFDLVTQIRRLNTEMNRLRIPMPFDLRQVMNQIRDQADDMTYGGSSSKSVSAMEIALQLKQMRNKWLPEMKRKIKDFISKAKLAEKVQAETIRAENEKTITKKEREEKEPDVTGKSKPADDGVTEPDGSKSGGNTTKTKTTEKTTTSFQPSGGSGGKPSPDAETARIMRALQKENDAKVKQAAKNEGDDSGGTNAGAAAAGALALLALLGQG